MKFPRIEISYDCVVIEGYQTRTKKYYGKLSTLSLFKSKDCIVLSMEPSFLWCGQSDTDPFGTRLKVFHG